MYFFFGNHFENKEPEAETRRGLRRAGGASLQWSLLRVFTAPRARYYSFYSVSFKTICNVAITVFCCYLDITLYIDQTDSVFVIVKKI